MQDFPSSWEIPAEAPPCPARQPQVLASGGATATLPSPSRGGRTLFQDSFFFCNVPGIGNLPGAGSIYLETAVDRDSGVAFAKIYSTRKSVNGVDLLTSRVVPFFNRSGEIVKEVHTRHTSEYCGPAPKHPFHTFLTTAGIRHVSVEAGDHGYARPCQEFFGILVKEFLQPALRKSFHVSIETLQKDLDAFIEAYNSGKSARVAS